MMIGTFLQSNGTIFIKGRSVKNKPIEPYSFKIGNSKKKLLKTLLKSYKLLNFVDYDLFDLASMSIKQWRRREYPVPEGYSLKYSHSFDPKKLAKQNWNFRKKSIMDKLF